MTNFNLGSFTQALQDVEKAVEGAGAPLTEASPTQLKSAVEHAIIHRYVEAALRAKRVGLALHAGRADFVLSDETRGCQEHARCPSLDAVDAAIARREEALRQD